MTVKALLQTLLQQEVISCGRCIMLVCFDALSRVLLLKPEGMYFLKNHLIHRYTIHSDPDSNTTYASNKFVEQMRLNLR